MDFKTWTDDLGESKGFNLKPTICRSTGLLFHIYSTFPNMGGLCYAIVDVLEILTLFNVNAKPEGGTRENFLLP